MLKTRIADQVSLSQMACDIKVEALMSKFSETKKSISENPTAIVVKPSNDLQNYVEDQGDSFDFSEDIEGISSEDPDLIDVYEEDQDEEVTDEVLDQYIRQSEGFTAIPKVQPSDTSNLNGYRPRYTPKKITSTYEGNTTLPVLAKASSEREELGYYLQQIRQYPLLTKEEELQLTQQYVQNQDALSAKRLVTSNLRLVVKIAMEYRRNWVNAMDLIQEGNLGLMEAVKRFDPMRGVRFSSFARYWIRALILQYILKNFRMVSFANTRAGRKLFFRLEKERAKLIALYGQATTKQLALNLGVDESDVEIANALKQAPISLSEPKWSQDQDGPSLIDTLEDQEMTPEAKVIRNEFQTVLFEQMQLFEQTLENERDLVIWRERLISEDPVALSELGERFHISRERVRQLENRIKKKLEQQIRENLGEDFILNINPNRQKAKVDA